MIDAVKEIFQSSSSITDTAVSVDGSWQRRGFSSLNGVVTAISMDTDKILDCEPMSRPCKASSLKLKLKKSNHNAFKTWKSSLVCKLNCRGSAPGMEMSGYKSYSFVRETYSGITVYKLECVGHMQKRVGSRLRNFRKTIKGLGGKES